MMCKKIALSFLFFSGQAFSMLISPVRKTCNDQLTLIPNAVFIMNYLNFKSNARLLMTCTRLYKTYKAEDFALSPKAYMQKMIHASRLNKGQEVGLFIGREAKVHKRQRESLLQHFQIKRWNLNTIMSVYKKGYDPECEDFIQLNADVTFEDLAKNPVLCQLSLEQGLSPNIVYMDDTFNDTLLIYAVREGNPKVVKVLLSDNRTKPNKENKNGHTPLHYAIDKKDLGVVTELLLGHPEIDPNKGDSGGSTPLHRATIQNKLEQINFLLGHPKIDPNKKNKEGTPLHDAIFYDNGAIDLLLGNTKIDPNEKDIKGRTPFHFAILRKNAKAIELLLAHPKFDPDQEDKNGQTCLLYAIKTWAPDIKTLEKLLDKSKDTNFFWYNFDHYVSCNGLQFDISSLLSQYASSKARFLHSCGYMTGFIRKNIFNRVVGITSPVGNIINGSTGTLKCVIADVTFSVAAIGLAYCCKALISSSNSSSSKEK